MWFITAADRPALAQIEAKVREIEKLRGDSRLSFIKDVGQATQILTDEQRRALLGHSTTNVAPIRTDSQSAPGNMGDM